MTPRSALQLSLRGLRTKQKHALMPQRQQAKRTTTQTMKEASLCVCMWQWWWGGGHREDGGIFQFSVKGVGWHCLGGERLASLLCEEISTSGREGCWVFGVSRQTDCPVGAQSTRTGAVGSRTRAMLWPTRSGLKCRGLDCQGMAAPFWRWKKVHLHTCRKVSSDTGV